ncbi:MAG: hypothetical protein LLF89_01260 [Spirochaetaceae bacterium]|nr:hypothetical protein [Spirochaetaceae bacterium]
MLFRLRCHYRRDSVAQTLLFFLVAFFLVAGSASTLLAQENTEPFAGTLLASELDQSPAADNKAGSPGAAAPPGDMVKAYRQLRDAVYNNAPPNDVSAMAASLLKTIQASRGDNAGAVVAASSVEIAIFLSKVEYFAGRSWQEHGDNKKAIAYFEAALKHADEAQNIAQSAESLFAHTRALSQLVLLKGMPYLIANGPKISPNAKKILTMEPGHPGAQIILASSKAYTPPAFGGAPKEAISQMQELLKSHQGGFEKDTLFDIRTCLGTAYSKLDDKKSASFWFRKALELYPRNDYAKKELEKLNK